ncbi:MAG TPA: dihydrofolate reductase family protein [Fimbriimonadaceae bacterium]|nr:dihydrofolate reductase family protein [Fimbriimonadaceae bacterium]
MRKLIVAEHISLDGVVQAPGGPDEDPSGGFAFGGWTVPYDSEAHGRVILALHEQPFELLLGRRTYDIWEGYWPNIQPGNPIADAFNRTVKHVATHRREPLAWKGSRALDGDLAGSVRELKASEGPDLLTWGSSDVVRQLLAAGLVDVLWLFVYPVLLGRGKRLFDAHLLPSSFTLAHAETSPTGVQILRLEYAGEVRTGSYT